MGSQSTDEYCWGLSSLKYINLPLTVTLPPAFTEICFRYDDDMFLMGENIKLTSQKQVIFGGEADTCFCITLKNSI